MQGNGNAPLDSAIRAGCVRQAPCRSELARDVALVGAIAAKNREQLLSVMVLLQYRDTRLSKHPDAQMCRHKRLERKIAAVSATLARRDAQA